MEKLTANSHKVPDTQILLDINLAIFQHTDLNPKQAKVPDMAILTILHIRLRAKIRVPMR